MKNESIDRRNLETEIDVAIKYVKETRKLELKMIVDDSDAVPCLIGEDIDGKPLAFIIDLWKPDSFTSRNLRLKNVKEEHEFFSKKAIQTAYLRVVKMGDATLYQVTEIPMSALRDSH